MISNSAILAKVILLLCLTDSYSSQNPGPQVGHERVLPGQSDDYDSTMKYDALRNRLEMPDLNNQSDSQTPDSAESHELVFRTNTGKESTVKWPSGSCSKMKNPNIEMLSKGGFCVEQVTKDELKRIKSEMKTQYRITNVTKVEKIVNAMLWDQYVTYREMIKLEGNPNECYLFPTFESYENFSSIPYKGYDAREVKHYPLMPPGLSFINKVLALSAPGKWITYLNRVALGNVKFTNFNWSHPFPPRGYNSFGITDPNTKQTSYIVWRGEQVYPEFRIYFNMN